MGTSETLALAGGLRYEVFENTGFFFASDSEII